MQKKYAIVGTASSWTQTPWDDPDLFIAGLNDGYQLEGFRRADAWYDFHPLNRFFYPPPAKDGRKPLLFAHSIPYGYYARPNGHLDWLAVQPFPKYLHPEFASQIEGAANWPQAYPFPKADVEAHFGRYFTSSPAWMLAHAIMQGYKHIEIYGIHLSTQGEYIDQRPGFEFLIGCVLGSSKRTETIKNGLRYYESQDGVIVLPEMSPVLASDHQYAFEPTPRRKADPLKWELHKAEIKKRRTLDALLTKPIMLPWRRFEEPIPDDPEGKMRKRIALTSTLHQELGFYECLVDDCRDQLARAGG